MDGLDELLTPEGLALLDSLPPYRAGEALALACRLRAEGRPPELVAAALTQARLRAKAEAKFGALAADLLYTPAGCEQATRPGVAERHARTFVEANARHVLDFGCGIGADCLAFVRAGLVVTAIESDPATAAIAAHNVPDATVVRADGLTVDLASFGADAIWLDPARRTAAGRRIADPERWSPAFSQAVDVARAFPVAGIKVAPGIAHGLLPADARVEWVSQNRELVEAVVWFGTASPGRWAVVDGIAFDSGARRADEPVLMTEPRELGPVLFEPDPAVIRSGGIARLCQDCDLAPVSEGIAYLSSPSAGAPNAVPDGLCEAFEVSDVLPLEPKAIGRALASRGIGRVEIKKRGTDADIARLHTKIRGRRTNTGTPGVLILSPVMGRHRAILARRIACAGRGGRSAAKAPTPPAD